MLLDKIIKRKLIFVSFLLTVIFGAAMISAQPPSRRANGKIAFTSTRDGNHEIYVMNADGSEQVRLTHNDTYDLYPAWSPDGRKIAYTTRKADLSLSVFIMNSDGSGLTEVAPNSSNPRWSPDGRKLAVYGYWEIGQTNGVNIVDLDTGSVRNLVLGGNPIWSPDGSRIIFSKYGSYPSVGCCTDTLHSIDLDGTDLRPLQNGLSNGLNEGALNSSISRNKIVFTVNWWDYGDAIFIADPDGTNRQYFHGCQSMSCDGGERLGFADWSPDGQSIVFSIGTSFYSDTEIYVKNPDGTGLTQLTNTVGINYDPSWAPLRSVVSVSGKVTTPDGRGLRNATVTLTDSLGMRRTATTSSFGLYTFDDVHPGETFTIAASSKRFRFAPRTIQVNSDLSNVDLVGQE